MYGCIWQTVCVASAQLRDQFVLRADVLFSSAWPLQNFSGVDLVGFLDISLHSSTLTKALWWMCDRQQHFDQSNRTNRATAVTRWPDDMRSIMNSVETNFLQTKVSRPCQSVERHNHTPPELLRDNNNNMSVLDVDILKHFHFPPNVWVIQTQHCGALIKHLWSDCLPVPVVRQHSAQPLWPGLIPSNLSRDKKKIPSRRGGEGGGMGCDFSVRTNDWGELWSIHLPLSLSLPVVF